MGHVKSKLTPALWVANLIIGFEILFMISPFAVHFYSAYGPSLNLLHQWPETAWLSSFFLPHFAETSSGLLNALHEAGRVLVVLGGVLFGIGAGQIYYAKFTGKGAVTGGLYRFSRNPQYVAFAVMGLGVVLVWPRFTVLIVFGIMLFAYYFLASWEEKLCREKYGCEFAAYAARTPMFFPGFNGPRLSRVTSAIESAFRRNSVRAVVVVCTVELMVLGGLQLQSHVIDRLSTSYTKDTATISVVAQLTSEEIDRIVGVALKDPTVMEKLKAAGLGSGVKFLNYIVPAEWYLPDVPLEVIPEGIQGHHQPTPSGDGYKVLFTRAKTTGCEGDGKTIIQCTFGREPIVVASVDAASGALLSIADPPPHVRWGDIPTPLF